MESVCRRPTPVLSILPLHTDAKKSHFYYTSENLEGRKPTCKEREKIGAEPPALSYLTVEKTSLSHNIMDDSKFAPLSGEKKDTHSDAYISGTASGTSNKPGPYVSCYIPGAPTSNEDTFTGSTVKTTGYVDTISI